MTLAHRPYKLLAILACAAVIATATPSRAGVLDLVKIAQSAGTASLLGGANFEASSTIGAGNYGTPGMNGIPTWGAWTFQANAGITSETSAIASANPPIPTGNYAAYLTGATSFSRSQTFQPGLWRLRFRGAQRLQGSPALPDTQAVRVTIGSSEVAEFVFRDGNYSTYTTRPFRITATTTMSVVFAGLESSQTAFIDFIEVEPISDWNDPTIWTAGSVPTAFQQARIPAGVAVAVSGNPECLAMRVEGELLALPEDTVLRTGWIAVMGTGARFEVGYENTPHEQKFTLTLLGNDPNANVMGAGSKFLMAENGGTIEMHGAPRLSWTKLASTVFPNATQITVTEDVDWEVGDRVIIAGTNNPSNDQPYPDQAENRQITNVTKIPTGGATIDLDAPLTYQHVGVLTTYVSGAKNWTLDQRAEVGLLTRNVKIQGAYAVNGFGGHVMIRNSQTPGSAAGNGRFSNVEFFKMGQETKLGRYPIHWHLIEGHGANDPQFVKNCSIRRSFNRAVVVHGSDYITVERNVAYNHIGHGIFLEDGGEQHNKIRYNLVLKSKKPVGQALLPTENSHNTFQNRSPASYWITNPNNEIVGNVAAGTEGVGFWLIFAEDVHPQSSTLTSGYFAGLHPDSTELDKFEDNVCHSSRLALDVNDATEPVTGVLIMNHSWMTTLATYLERFTAYACRDGLYAGVNENENIIFRENVLADNGTSITFAAYHTVKDSVVVADTGNLIQVAYGEPDMPSVYEHYDGAGRLRDSHLVGFDVSPRSVVRSVGGADKHTNHLFSGLTYDHAGLPRIALPDFFFNPLQENKDPRRWGITVVDEDGTLTGLSGNTLISNHEMMRTLADVAHLPGTYAWVSPHKFGHLKLDSPANNSGNDPEPEVEVTRTDFSGNGSVLFYHDYNIDRFRQLPVIVDADGASLTVPVYKIRWPVLPNAAQRPMDVITGDLAVDDVTLFRFDGIGALPGLSVKQNGANVPALTWGGMQGSSVTSMFFDQNNGVWLRVVNKSRKNTVQIDWTGP